MGKEKKCSKCGDTKPRSEFVTYKSGPKAGRLKRADCRDCASRSNREYNSRRRPDRVKRTRAVIAEALSAGCVDCGEDDLVVLQFDHRDPDSKEFNVGRALARTYALKRIRAEIEKCDVVCANCHARRTARAVGSWRLTHTQPQEADP